MPAPEQSDQDPIEAEYSSLLKQVVEQRERADRLRALADRVEENAARDEHLLGEVAALIGRDSQLRLEDLDPRLKGQSLREVAVVVLRREIGPGEPIHYKNWFTLLEAAGHKIGGKDPLATFLAQVHRSEDVESIGRRSGQFRLVA